MRRASAPPNDGDDAHGDADNNACPRQPFRPLQPRTGSSFALTPPAYKSTPPCEVILTPRATPKPIRRKSRLARTTKVKSEPPEIDLSKVRPPSPSDDPLLLSGTRTTRSPPLRARFTPPFSSSPPSSTADGPAPSLVARLSGLERHIAPSLPDADEHALPTFDAPRPVGPAVLSDSEDDEFNLTGEYTGKYKILEVPTQAGPPSRNRAKSWGRPVSPFPYSEIMERSLQDVAEADLLDCQDVSMWEVATEPPPSDVEPSPPPSASEDEFGDLDSDFGVFDVDAESTRVLSLVEPRERLLDSDPVTLEEQEEEDAIDRELSVAIDDGPEIPVAADQHVSTEDTSDEEDDVEGEDIIKITSEDPKAAARAAAILRLHDYDCILAAEKKRRSNRSTRRRRKTVENSGISKSYMNLDSRRLPTLQGGTSPGSRSLPLLELWRDAEDSVFLEHHSKSRCDSSFSFSPTESTTSLPEPQLVPPFGEWTRDCWKCLDRCLVAERLSVGAAHGLGTHVFAEMSEISKDAVLDRFTSRVGGELVLVGLGPDWSRDNLMLRLDVLVKKHTQRATQRKGEPRYRGLLEEAMALSETKGCDSASVSDVTVFPDRREKSETTATVLESEWRTRAWSGPIRTPTPVHMLDRRWPHPKDQVRLRHTSPPPKSRIPVPVGPKRLVDLRHCSLSKSDGQRDRPTRRRSSGCSVKELVRQYEGLDE